MVTQTLFRTQSQQIPIILSEVRRTAFPNFTDSRLTAFVFLFAQDFIVFHCHKRFISFNCSYRTLVLDYHTSSVTHHSTTVRLRVYASCLGLACGRRAPPHLSGPIVQLHRPRSGAFYESFGTTKCHGEVSVRIQCFWTPGELTVSPAESRTLRVLTQYDKSAMEHTVKFIGLPRVITVGGWTLIGCVRISRHWELVHEASYKTTCSLLGGPDCAEVGYPHLHSLLVIDTVSRQPSRHGQSGDSHLQRVFNPSCSNIHLRVPISLRGRL